MQGQYLKAPKSMSGEAMAASLAGLRQAWQDAPKVFHGDKAWVPIHLYGILCRTSFNAARQQMWCCVQVNGMVVDGTNYDLSAMDAHITIGTWINYRGTSVRFNRMLGRCIRSLADVTMLNFEVAFNEKACCDQHLVFQFGITSEGGNVLHAMSQRLNRGGLHQLEDPPRAMSPPGQTFHLSVYRNMRM